MGIYAAIFCVFHLLFVGGLVWASSSSSISSFLFMMFTFGGCAVFGLLYFFAKKILSKRENSKLVLLLKVLCMISSIGLIGYLLYIAIFFNSLEGKGSMFVVGLAICPSLNLIAVFYESTQKKDA